MSFKLFHLNGIGSNLLRLFMSFQIVVAGSGKIMRRTIVV